MNKKIVSLIGIITFIFCTMLAFTSCTTEPNHAEGIEYEDFSHKNVHPKETNKDKVFVELIHKNFDMKIYKITINDTLVSYIAYEHKSGYIKLN